MKLPTDLDFWHENLAMRIQSEITDSALTTGMLLQTDTNKGVSPFRLGSTPFFYYCDKTSAISFGYLVGTNNSEHTHFSMRDSSVLAKRHLIEHVIANGKPPFMFGEITKRSPINGFKISESRQHAFFCKADARFRFHTDRLSQLIHLCDGIPTPKVMQAFQLYSEYVFAPQSMPDTRRKKLSKLLDSHPTLHKALKIPGVDYGSGELEVFRWSRHEPKKDKAVKSEQIGEAA